MSTRQIPRTHSILFLCFFVVADFFIAIQYLRQRYIFSHLNHSAFIILNSSILPSATVTTLRGFAAGMVLIAPDSASHLSEMLVLLPFTAGRTPETAKHLRLTVDRFAFSSPHPLASPRFRLARTCKTLSLMRMHRKYVTFSALLVGQTEWRWAFR